PLHAEIAKGRRAVSGEFRLAHAFAHGGPRRAIGDDCEVVRLLHQRQLRRLFVHAATGGDRRRVHIFKPGRSLSNPIVEEKAHALFDSNPARADAAIFEYLRDAKIGTLVFFPGANVIRSDLDQLARAFFFKFWTNPGDVSALRNHQCEHAFTLAPTHAGEVVHAGAGLDVDRIHLLLAH